MCPHGIESQWILRMQWVYSENTRSNKTSISCLSIANRNCWLCARYCKQSLNRESWWCRESPTLLHATLLHAASIVIIPALTCTLISTLQYAWCCDEIKRPLDLKICPSHAVPLSCCYVEIKGTQDNKISHAHSLILSNPSALPTMLRRHPCILTTLFASCEWCGMQLHRVIQVQQELWISPSVHCRRYRATSFRWLLLRELRSLYRRTHIQHNIWQNMHGVAAME